LNAVTHGLLTKQVVVQGESIKVLNELRDNLMKEHEPQGQLETMLIEPNATCIWRLRRIMQVESDSLKGEYQQYKSYFVMTINAGYWQNFSRY
jgi:hypothetical protein